MRLVATHPQTACCSWVVCTLPKIRQVDLWVCAQIDASANRVNVSPFTKVVNMEQKAEKPAKTKSVSAMRKLTSELDAEVRKVETNKTRMVRLEKTIAEGNAKIKALTSQLAKHFS